MQFIKPYLARCNDLQTHRVNNSQDIAESLAWQPQPTRQNAEKQKAPEITCLWYWSVNIDLRDKY
ncbi:MAG: hypothetical protein QNJ72_07375 [Pleurocapsa sp. MO_226.B13]|nr:hypothetical protein [Pleurocapsa sp. MO_226.B13]